MSGPVVSVVVPAFDEAATIGGVLARLRAVPIDKEIVVVDDGSTDGTAAALAAVAGPDLVVLRHPKNRGKGAALRTGFAAARGEVVVVQDADLEYEPAEIPALVAPILAGRADAVYGSRYLHRRPPADLPTRANLFLTRLSNIALGLRLTDMETGHKAIRRTVLRSLPLREERFAIEPEITALLVRRGARIVEVPATYRRRTRAQGKKIGWLDGAAAVAAICRYAGRP